MSDQEPALTTLGLGPDEMSEAADIIATALRATGPAMTNAGQSRARYTTNSNVAESCRR